MSQQRKRASRQVTLVLSGALSWVTVSGCSRSIEQMDVQTLNDPNAYTNNAYVPGRGYYHSGSRIWYPYSWGYHDPDRGFFHDGNWSKTPQASPGLQKSIPIGIGHAVSHSFFSGIVRGGFGGSSHFCGS